MIDLSPYAGQWVAVSQDRVIGAAETAEEVQKIASLEAPQAQVSIQYVEGPGGDPLPFSSLYHQLRQILARENKPIYLVGGAVRDAVLGQGSKDLDFVLADQAISLAFRVANALGVPAYVLDQERDTGRVVLADQGTMLDFARFRGTDLITDLADRDFTINALAVPATAQTSSAIIDPTGGLADIQAKTIRCTNSEAILRDPVRALRAVRLAHQLGFSIADDTRELIGRAAPLIDDASEERIRDEVLKIIGGPDPDQAILTMESLTLLQVVLPEIEQLRLVEQSPPHHEDVLAHTVSVLHWLTLVEQVFLSQVKAANGFWLTLQTKLSGYLEALQKHIGRPVDGGLDGRTVLYLGALFHDVGKKGTFTVDEHGQIRFFDHAQVGANLTGKRLRTWCLSKDAVHQVKRIVEGHMRPLMLLQAQGADLSRRAVYRYFQATKVNGIDIGLLALADHLATYNGPGDDQQWLELVKLVERLFHYYFEKAEETVRPKPLVNGGDLIAHLQLEPGPEIGRILRLIEENQAAGEISTRQEALQFAQDQLS